MKEFNTKYKVGFTLVELLVVIGIIGILAGIVYASFGDARKSARDDIRKSDLKNLELALKLYKAQNGRYPAPGCGNWSGGGDDTRARVNKCNNYITGLVPDYIAKLPLDPLTRSDAEYIYRIDLDEHGTEYKLMAWRSVEKKTVNSFDDEFARCPKPLDGGACSGSLPKNTPEFNNTYAVYSAGAGQW